MTANEPTRASGKESTDHDPDTHPQIANATVTIDATGGKWHLESINAEGELVIDDRPDKDGVAVSVTVAGDDLTFDARAIVDREWLERRP